MSWKAKNKLGKPVPIFFISKSILTITYTYYKYLFYNIYNLL